MNHDPAEIDRLHDAARGSIRDAMTRLGVASTVAIQPGVAAAPLPVDPDAPARRRMVLVDRGDGAMEWRDPTPAIGMAAPRRDVADAPAAAKTVVDIEVEELPPNRIIARLESFDASLTPHQGLRRWRPDGTFEPLDAVPPRGDRPEGPSTRDLLVIHGTFSNSESLFDQLAGVERDAGFLSWAAARYRNVLTFDHPTLSVSPVLNAMDLARTFADVRHPVDVICHSRGGLVARWWLEAFGGAAVAERRVVFVASPLGGTSLASPDRIRQAFDLFTTVGAFLRDAGAAASVCAPFTGVAVGLMQVFVAVTGSVANTPMADLFFNAVPGLGAMSRVGNSPELQRLHSGSSSPLPYFSISSDFQMERAGWRFWRLFQDPTLRGASWGASLVFEQANDLVVDDRSTCELFTGKGIPPGRRLDLGTNGAVHHTNYFQQEIVLTKIREFLG